MFERYGNWIANTRMPVLPWIRRLAKSNPHDFGKMILINTAYVVTLRLVMTAILRSTLSYKPKSSLKK